MFKQTLILLLIAYVCSEGMVSRGTYEMLKKTASYKVKDWNKNPFRKISKEVFYTKFASAEIPSIKPTFGQSISSLKDVVLPTNYDARDDFPDCTPIIKNQGQCGSSPAFAGASALAFRFCMATGNNVELSPQDQIACTRLHCRLGDLVSTWDFYEKQGLITEKCFPFKSGNKTEFPECLNNKKTCVDESEEYLKYKAVAGSSMPFESELDIKQEILKNGPIQAGMFLFESLLHYDSGIYQAKQGKMIGWHAVTLIGWGEEDGVKYYIAQNSWGEDWGEKGLFKIEVETAGISSYGYAGLPDVEGLRYPF